MNDDLEQLLEELHAVKNNQNGHEYREAIIQKAIDQLNIIREQHPANNNDEADFCQLLDAMLSAYNRKINQEEMFTNSHVSKVLLQQASKNYTELRKELVGSYSRALACLHNSNTLLKLATQEKKNEKTDAAIK